MKKITLFISMLFVILLSYLISPVSAKTNQAQVSSCVACHTNDQILKRLFVPPKVQASEGEG